MNKTIQVIGHRGARDLAPENTLPSFQAAIDLGLSAIEFDVTLSKDGVPVVVHQETLAPGVTGALELVGRDPARAWVREFDYSELRSMDAGAWYGQEGVVIPGLEQVLNLAWGSSSPIIEFIDASFWKDEVHRETQEATRLLSASFPIYDSLQDQFQSSYFLSFNAWILERCAEEFHSVPRILAIWKNDQGRHEEVIERALAVKAEHITIADTMIIEDPSWIRAIQDAGLKVWAYDLTPDLYESFGDWDIHSRMPIWSKLIELGVDGIEADFPDALQKAVNSGFSSD